MATLLEFRKKTLANSQISVFRVINFRENVRNLQKLQKFLPAKVSAL